MENATEEQTQDQQTEEQEVERIRVIPGIGVLASKLIAKLKEGKIGDVLTDIVLTEIAGADTRVGGDGYGSLGTAIKYCEREGIIWARVRKADCIKCLDDYEKLESGKRRGKAIHRRSKRVLRILGAVDRESLSDLERREYDAQFAQQSVVAVFSSTRTRKKLEERCPKREVDTKGLIEFMSESSESGG